MGKSERAKEDVGSHKVVANTGPAKLSKQQKRDLKKAQKSQAPSSSFQLSSSSSSSAKSVYKRVPCYPAVPSSLAEHELLKLNRLGRLMHSRDAYFEEVMAASYSQFKVDEPVQFSPSFHERFQRSLKGLEGLGYYQYDFTQPAGLGTKVAQTMVTRCLVGEPGITYKYLGLRMFGFSWRSGDVGAVKELVAIGHCNSELQKRTAELLTPESGSCRYNLTLINSCAPLGSGKVKFKEEPFFGGESITVAWHADSSLQHYSSIGVYHYCDTAEKIDDVSWRIALRVAPNAEGPAAGKKTPEVTVPAIAVPLRSGSVYYLLDEFNHHHQHSVLAGTCQRYSSTHRCSREEGHCFGWLKARCEKAISEGATASSSVIRTQQLAAAELEFEWLRQFYIQGKRHYDQHLWWHEPIASSLSWWRVLEINCYKQIKTLLDYSVINSLDFDTVDRKLLKSFKKRKHRAASVTVESFITMIEFLEEKQSKRDGWTARENDSIFATASSECRPLAVPFPPVDHELSAQSLTNLIEILKAERGKSFNSY